MSVPPLPDLLPVNLPQVLSAASSKDGEIPLPPVLTPLPELRPPIIWPWPRFRYINTGAWLVNYELPGVGIATKFDGTIRVENNAAGRTASGDLYQRPGFWINFPGLPRQWLSRPPPSPSGGIPIQPRKAYRYYLRITRIDEFFSFGSTFKLGFQKYKYVEVDKNNFTWTQEPADSEYTATMTWTTAPAGYPFPSDYAEGDVVLDKTGAVEGRLKMGRVSDFYRKVVVEIDNVPGSERPLDNGIVGPGHED
ncbi:hypothetical protein TWF281_000321 [Arthrobotrys megalospora]